ncbi:hypothetical protein [Mycobacterium sp. UM_CSW]|uniref:hypothetical protein n=1 Tax=Mycobacterium sp. UM_CSW TaxID=1370119 RepID=UPI0018725445|nr:hypothetical protein [Mycobacterium sp. UM_CSW]
MVTSGLFGFLTLLALMFALLFAAVAAVHVKRLEGRPPPPISDEIGSAKAVTRKVRKREPMSQEELDYARHLLGARSSVLTLCIPGALFSLGCFYVFGSLYHLHGATPSERTFLGLFPILASINLTTQIIRSARLKRRLQKIS